jgi:hypothetical protein
MYSFGIPGKRWRIVKGLKRAYMTEIVILCPLKEY